MNTKEAMNIIADPQPSERALLPGVTNMSTTPTPRKGAGVSDLHKDATPMERAQWCKDAGLSVGWLVFRNEENEQLKAGFAHLQSQLDECRKERDEALRLAEGLQRYVEYLHEADSKTAVYLATLGWKWPNDFIARGDKLRADIAALSWNKGQP